MRCAFLSVGIACLVLAGSVRCEDDIIDRVAADFYENALRHAQSRNIEAATAEIYRSLEPGSKVEFRQDRRRQWREMSEPKRRSLRGAKTPQYENLTEEQKRPFRRAAEDQLGAGEPRAANRRKEEI